MQTFFSPGEITRGGLLVVATIFMILKSKLWLSSYNIFLAVLCILLLVSVLIAPNFPDSLLFDIKAAARVLYGPFVVLVFLALIKHYDVSAERLLFYVEISFYLIGISLLIQSFFDIGKDTYGSYAYGFKGLFKPQNDIGLSSAITLAAALYGNLVKPSFVRLIMLCLAMLGVVGMGTRTAMAAPVVVMMAIILVVLIARIASFERSGRPLRIYPKTFFLIIIFPLFATFYSYSLATGVSIVPSFLDDVFHNEAEALFPSGAKNTNVSNINTDPITTTKARGTAKPRATEYQKMKMERTAKGVVYRKDLLDGAVKYTSQRPIAYDFFGEGAYSFRSNVAKQWPNFAWGKQKYVEMDWFDLYGEYGVLFSILLTLFYFYFLLLAVFYFFTSKKVEFGVFALMFGLYIAHSLIAGHAMNSPMVSTLIAAIIGFLLFFRSSMEKIET
ncbi:O-antigen ligase family protein [Parahaliea sp. F7430]|uniref:O-antigen ligase family protein n=1 Tax=Sediminihaliea albiluteola TaxID=2758564 RepID=A0A7W2TY29_9GAMM|nr:O-antigen ligase family protein [Sediminihaliea albiluteola]MBA6414069.1 O-antigen ligase family protein [Sediminihaliea albiluteola]